MHWPVICALLISSCAIAADDVLADLDLPAPDGKPPTAALGLDVVGATWTADGLFLPAAVVARVPQAYPMDGDAFPAARSPYRADLALPGLTGRSVTISMVVCLASADGDQDNLFSLGRRSRWLSAQVGKDGRVVVGLDNRWVLMSAGEAAGSPPPLTGKRWHAVSVALGADRSVRLAVDGVVAELKPVQDRARFPPRSLPDDQPVLSLSDPGSARHLHGLVRRLLVQRGQLDREALVALHRRLVPAGLPTAQAAVFVQAQSAALVPLPEDPSTQPPVGASDF